MVPVAGSADASGYMNFARLLSEGSVSEPLRRADSGGFAALPEHLFQPLGMTYRSESGELAPVYPPGLPMVLAFGELHERAMAVRLLYALIGGLGCLGMYFLARGFGLRPIWGFFAATMLGTSPLFLWSSLILMSDALATAQAIWVMVFALWGRRRKGALVLCGALLGWAVLTRLTNVLLFVPALLVLLGGRVGIRGFVCWLLGGVPFLVLLLWLNERLYGSVLATGYGEVGSLFSGAYLLPNLAHYLDTLWYAVFFAVLPGAFLALGRLREYRIWVLFAWVLPVLAFYAFYLFTFQTWWFMRFNLVAVPGLIVLAAFGLEKLVRRSVRWEFRSVAMAAVAACLALVVWEGKRSIFNEQEFERRYVKAADWAARSIPEGSLVVSMQASGALYYYTEFAIFRWDLASDGHWEAAKAAASAAQVPVFALLQGFEESDERSLVRRDPGAWEALGEVAPRMNAYRMR